MLNTESPKLLAGREPPPAVADSVLCFGVPAYSGRTQSTMDPDEIAWEIKRRIIAFESRIDRHTLEVNALNTQQRHRFNKLHFSVHGFLRADPLPIEFLVHTELDMETGQALVTG
jgi:type VI secretion system protein ImpF